MAYVAGWPGSPDGKNGPERTPPANQYNQWTCERSAIATTSGINTSKFIRSWPWQSIHVTKALPGGSSEWLFEALKNAGASVTFCAVAGAGHEDPNFNSEMMRAAVEAFIDKYLKAKHSKSQKVKPIV
jgi:hypothetical protein